jgi:hypothetical protein
VLCGQCNRGLGCFYDSTDALLSAVQYLVCGLPKRNAKEGFAEQGRIMADAPSWADGLPVRLDGFRTDRYRK